jgi:inorganic triphosphatase YgiF
MDHGGDPKEIELTLKLEPGSVGRLLRAPSLKPMRAGPKRTQRLQSVYYDTRDLRLHRHRVALRVRRVGDGFVQTLKTASSSNAPAIERGEWERAVSGERPELGGFADKRLRKLLDHGRLGRASRRCSRPTSSAR